LGGPAAHPHFFSGFLSRPRQTAQALLPVAEVARTRYFEPPGMCAHTLAADPVVTSLGDQLRAAAGAIVSWAESLKRAGT
jgi:hypothetical protein